MKALTLHQPWASLVACGRKKHETRSWPPPSTSIGTEIAIHAGKKPMVRLHSNIQLLKNANLTEEGLRDTYGCIIATAYLCGAFRVAALKEHSVTGQPVAIVQPGSEMGIFDSYYYGGEKAVTGDDKGNWETGRWIWCFRGCYTPPLTEDYVPCRGLQKLWNVPPDAERAVETWVPF